MTVETTPFAIQTGGETAEQFRRLLHATFGGRPGIFDAAALAVTQNGTPNMSVIVAGGQVLVPGTQATYQGLYFGENRGAVTKTITASDPTNPRRDLIVASVRDAQYSGSFNDFDIRVITGTPAATPADPPTPDNAFLLARVAVAAGATSITNANITDLRFTAVGGGMATPAGVPSGAWTAYTPTFTQSVTVGKTITYARYFKVGRFVHVQAYLTATSNGMANNPIRVGLPFTAVQSNLPVGTFYWYDASAPANFLCPAWLGSTTTVGSLISGSNGLQLGHTAGIGGITYPNRVDPNDAILMDVTYEATA